MEATLQTSTVMIGDEGQALKRQTKMNGKVFFPLSTYGLCSRRPAHLIFDERLGLCLSLHIALQVYLVLVQELTVSKKHQLSILFSQLVLG